MPRVDGWTVLKHLRESSWTSPIPIIVVTANHYILDAIGGAVVFSVGYLLAKAFTARMDARAAVATV